MNFQTELQNNVCEAYTLIEKLEKKGDEYRYPCALMVELIEYLVGGRCSIQLTGLMVEAIVQNKTLTEIVELYPLTAEIDT
jgi:hypothetical protein